MKKLSILLFSLLIIGCSNVNNNSSSFVSNQISSENSFSSFNSISSSNEDSSSNVVSSSSKSLTSSSSTSSSTSINSTSLTSSSSSVINNHSSSKLESKMTIKLIKKTADSFKGLENSVGVYESNNNVTINLELLACLDAVTTKSGYGDRYKILMSDGNDYIYLKTSLENYEYLKKYVTENGEYKVSGNISLYNNEVELTVKEKPVYLATDDIKINYDDLAESLSLESIYSNINSLKLNTKGIAFSKIVSVNVKCLAKDINNTNLYFGNGDYIINVHGHDKVTNKFVAGKSYTLYGALSMHNFRPSLEYVYSYSLDNDIEVNFNNAQVVEAKSLYNYTYKVDEDSSYPKYTKLFEKPLKVKGYLNSYIKNNKEYLVFEDSFNENYYSTYQNAVTAKAIFFVNENYIELNTSNTKYCPIYEHLDKGTQLEIIIFPYLWNTLKYPQVYCYSFNEIL